MQDLTGQKFGKLTVLKVFRKENKYYCECKCECGNIKNIRKDHLLTQKTTSCGCYRIKNTGDVHRTHGKTNTLLYSKYEGMKRRCYNTNDARYKYYGARGIAVCNEWLNSFEAFYEWATNNGYKKGLTLDRINVNGNYCPENCRWIDIKIQTRNRRSNLIFTYNNETLCLKDWAIKYNIKYNTLVHRINRNWSIKRALNTP